MAVSELGTWLDAMIKVWGFSMGGRGYPII